MLTGENGILSQAQKAKTETENAATNEAARLDEYNSTLENWINGETTGENKPATDGTWSDEKGVNTPVIKNNMELVKWDGSQFVADDTNSSYDYNSQQWANAKVTIDGIESYFVWIPRYAYKITYNEDKTAGTIDVKFLIGTTDQYYDDNGNIQTAKRVTEENVDTSSDYYVHPAFTDETSVGFENGGWNEELTGIWVGKYESSLVNKADSSNITTSSSTIGNILLSENTDKAIAVQPGMSSWRYCTIGNIYTNAKAYSTSLNSHMLKNSEWGAVAYLTESKYGRNGTEVTINNSSEYITDSAETSSGTTNDYKSAEGVLASSTGNVTGIYDLSGGAYEYVPGYYTGGGSYLTNNGSSFADGSSDEYSTAYTGTSASTAYKPGDATYETIGWHDDSTYFVNSSAPFFSRGGRYNNSSTSAGVFHFSNNYGTSYNNHSFRMCLAVK